MPAQSARQSARKFTPSSQPTASTSSVLHCTGSTPGATNATLTFMAGGERRVFDRVLPWLEAMGKKIYYCGGAGMGLHAKLSQNLVLSNLMEAFNEAIVLSTKAGVDPVLMLDILSNSAAKSGLIEYKAPFILDRNFEANFSVKWMHKDVELMLESGQELGVPLEMTSLTERLFRNHRWWRWRIPIFALQSRC